MLQNSSDLERLVFPDGSGSFFDVTHLKDRRVGISTKIYYPDNIGYKPPINRDGTPDTVAVIWFVYLIEEAEETRSSLERIPLKVRISNYSNYRSKNYDYNFSDPLCPTEESISRSKNTPRPLDLEYNGRFFFDHNLDAFVDSDGKYWTGIGILNLAFDEHCKTVHRIKGFAVQMRILFHTAKIDTLGLLIRFLEFTLKWLFGRTLEENDSITSFYEGYKEIDFKKLNEDSINLFGYKASKRVIIIFCLMVGLASLVRYFWKTKFGYFSFVAKSNLLTIVHVLIILFLLDVIIPRAIFKLINYLIRKRGPMMYAKLKAF